MTIFNSYVCLPEGMFVSVPSDILGIFSY